MWALNAGPRWHGDRYGAVDGELTCIPCGYVLLLPAHTQPVIFRQVARSCA